MAKIDSRRDFFVGGGRSSFGSSARGARNSAKGSTLSGDFNQRFTRPWFSPSPTVNYGTRAIEERVTSDGELGTPAQLAPVRREDVLLETVECPEGGSGDQKAHAGVRGHAFDSASTTAGSTQSARNFMILTSASSFAPRSLIRVGKHRNVEQQEIKSVCPISHLIKLVR
ncbi:MAG TPA: hypothetical protein VNF49_11955 [Candidatus Binataceae bacterium]|nr:hypothetical protein [Candidatus Binataceae bacterium]